ncbi:MAG: amidohydrolase [Anaerolineales bacterium]
MTQTMLVRDAIVVTVDREGQIFDNGAVVWRGDRIIDVGPTEEVTARWPDSDRVINGSGKAVVPGFVNTHMHSLNSSIRGMADDALGPLWLNTFINPMHQAATADDAYAMARLTYFEALRSGTTCGLDMARFMDRCADAAAELGFRVVVSPYAANVGGYEYFETFEGNERLVKDRHNSADGRVKVWFGIEMITYSTRDHYLKARRAADHYGVGIHLHANCEVNECRYAREHYGAPPLELFYQWGILGSDVVAAHCVVLTESEVNHLVETGTSVAHCPQSGMKVALGTAPVPELLSSGVNVCLGTDGGAENNAVNMVETLKFTALMHKLNKLDPTVMPAEKVLELATMGGARALGLDKDIGSLEVGKKADLVIFDLRHPYWTPIVRGPNCNIVSQLVYSAQGDSVDTVVVDGRVLVEGGQLLTADQGEVIERANRVALDMADRREVFAQSRDREFDSHF